MGLKEYIDRYKRNIRFFKKNYPQIYEYLNEESMLIYENGQPNIIVEGKTLYPLKYEQEVKDHIEVFLNSNFASVYIKPSDPNEYMHHRLQYWGLRKLEDKMLKLETTPQTVKELDFIPFLIVYGLGLGYHLKELFEVKEIGVTIIVEPDPSNLIASMYTVEWEELFKKGKIYFILGKAPRKQAQEVVRIVKNNNIMYIYHVLIYIHFLQGVKEFTYELSKEVIKEPGNWGFVDDELTSLEHTYINFLKEIPLYNAKKLSHSVPIFVIGSGPSLDETLPYIKKFKDRALIFAAGTAIKPLVTAGIIPDYTFALERLKVTYNAFKQAVPQEILKDLNIIGSNVIYPPFFEISKFTKLLPRTPDTASKIYFKLNLTQPVSYQTPTVTNMALAFGAFLGSKEIYLFGVDLGFKDPTYHHSKTTIYSDEGEFKTQKMKTFRKVEGNFCDEVYTTDIYELAKDKMEMLLQHYKNLKLYNTSDGAKIKGSIPLKAKDIALSPLKKESILKEIENFFIKGYVTPKNKEFINKEYSKLLNDLDELIEIVKQLKIDPSHLEKELFEKTTALYLLLEQRLSKEKEMMYTLIRGTLYHFASFYYSYLSRLSGEKKFIFSEYALKLLLILLKKTKKEVKKMIQPPIIESVKKI